jgi:hypothetical protein
VLWREGAAIAVVQEAADVSYGCRDRQEAIGYRHTTTSLQKLTTSGLIIGSVIAAGSWYVPWTFSPPQHSLFKRALGRLDSLSRSYGNIPCTEALPEAHAIITNFFLNNHASLQ